MKTVINSVTESSIRAIIKYNVSTPSTTGCQPGPALSISKMKARGYPRVGLSKRQRVEDFQLGIESYQTQLNLTKPRWDATGFEFKHDFTVIDSPRAVTFRDKYGVQMISASTKSTSSATKPLNRLNEHWPTWSRNSRSTG
ncbi:hypothetical protein Tco_0235788 [Tanacetum coccineum]